MNAQHIIGQISDTIIHGNYNRQGGASTAGNDDRPDISELISLSIENDVPAPLIASDGLDRPMLDVITRFKNDDFAFIEMIARATLAGEARKILADHVENPESLSKGKMLLATVKGEYHRHGKDIVSSLSRGLGIDTIDLGTGITANEIIDAANEHKPDFLGISASTRATIPDLKKLMHKIQEDHTFEDMSVILGGYLAVDEEADAIAVDYQCSDLSQTIELLSNLTGNEN